MAGRLSLGNYSLLASGLMYQIEELRFLFHVKWGAKEGCEQESGKIYIVKQ